MLFRSTYKYAAVGPYYQNGDFMPDQRAFLYVPPGFPGSEGAFEDDVLYDDPTTSPVLWGLYSLGSNPRKNETYEQDMIKQFNGPVARRSWYTPEKKEGLVVRIRLRGGRHVGSFEGYR